MRALLAFLIAAALVPAALAAAGRPHLRVVSLAPARITGTGFHARERVVVTVTGTTAHLKKSVLTTAAGTFVARFQAAATASGCHQLAVVAVGTGGDRAAWKSPQKPCGPPPSP